MLSRESFRLLCVLIVQAIKSLNPGREVQPTSQRPVVDNPLGMLPRISMSI